MSTPSASRLPEWRLKYKGTTAVREAEEIIRFVKYYNHRRYHKALGNVTPVDVLTGIREMMLQHRREVQVRTLERRKRYNRQIREVESIPPNQTERRRY